MAQGPVGAQEVVGLGPALGFLGRYLEVVAFLHDSITGILHTHAPCPPHHKQDSFLSLPILPSSWPTPAVAWKCGRAGPNIAAVHDSLVPMNEGTDPPRDRQAH